MASGRCDHPCSEKAEIFAAVHFGLTSLSFVICPSVWPLNYGETIAAARDRVGAGRKAAVNLTTIDTVIPGFSITKIKDDPIW
ncbi:hypothetical protein GCM10011395_23060 [Sphingomonas psychrolutea]|uniref:Uncharacterized protein n=1 Tax=Sphingomonas psychrolutea TaxID=1259676 RepID=A0ABQ1GX01_9SPHN|nr:hypothetical protein GCM10011395_23060 [Sphingomonas psychrolutea]